MIEKCQLFTTEFLDVYSAMDKIIPMCDDKSSIKIVAIGHGIYVYHKNILIIMGKCLSTIIKALDKHDVRIYDYHTVDLNINQDALNFNPVYDFRNLKLSDNILYVPMECRL